MPPHLWIEFALACTVMGLIPGPVVISICGYALGAGTRTAFAAVAGTALGSLIAMSLSLAGVGALLTASATAFAVLRWAGALYLIGLGLLTIARSTGSAVSAVAPAPIAPRQAFRSNLVLGTFHPKTLIFFIAFAPQFIDPRKNYALQAGVLIGTFVLIVATTDTLYALLAVRASRLLRIPSASRWMRRAGGSVLVAAGAATALSRT